MFICGEKRRERDAMRGHAGRVFIQSPIDSLAGPSGFLPQTAIVQVAAIRKRNQRWESVGRQRREKEFDSELKLHLHQHRSMCIPRAAAAFAYTFPYLAGTSVS